MKIAESKPSESREGKSNKFTNANKNRLLCKYFYIFCCLSLFLCLSLTLLRDCCGRCRRHCLQENTNTHTPISHTHCSSTSCQARPWFLYRPLSGHGTVPVWKPLTVTNLAPRHRLNNLSWLS